MNVSGAALPFTRMFYGRSSEYLWEMDNGECTASLKVRAASRAIP